MASDKPSMRIRQYTYFALESETVPAAAITSRVGVQPDNVVVRGARRSNPPVPVCHAWKIECRQPGLSVDDQVAQVLDRLRPVADRVRSLTASAAVSAVLLVVRDFGADNGEPECLDRIVTDNGLTLQKLSGQHQLLGWHLAAEDLAFLASIPAALVVDEYG